MLPSRWSPSTRILLLRLVWVASSSSCGRSLSSLGCSCRASSPHGMWTTRNRTSITNLWPRIRQPGSATVASTHTRMHIWAHLLIRTQPIVLEWPTIVAFQRRRRKHGPGSTGTCIEWEPPTETSFQRCAGVRSFGVARKHSDNHNSLSIPELRITTAAEHSAGLTRSQYFDEDRLTRTRHLPQRSHTDDQFDGHQLGGTGSRSNNDLLWPLKRKFVVAIADIYLFTFSDILTNDWVGGIE